VKKVAKVEKRKKKREKGRPPFKDQRSKSETLTFISPLLSSFSAASSADP